MTENQLNLHITCRHSFSNVKEQNDDRLMLSDDNRTGCFWNTTKVLSILFKIENDQKIDIFVQLVPFSLVIILNQTIATTQIQ